MRLQKLKSQSETMRIERSGLYMCYFNFAVSYELLLTVVSCTAKESRARDYRELFTRMTNSYRMHT